MKKIILFLIISATVYCSESKSGYSDFYTTFGFFSDEFKEYVPSISIGKRKVSENGNGIDFGVSGAYLERNHMKDDYVIIFPKVGYIHYGTKNLDKINGFIGVGAGSAAYRFHERAFSGLVADATVGIDFFRDKNLNGFIQTRAYYPVLSFSKKYEKKQFPLVQFDVGLAF